MADVIQFAPDLQMLGPAAMMRVICRYARDHAGPDDTGLARWLSREDEFDAMGGWFLDRLTHSELVRVRHACDAVQANLPAALAAWNEASRPMFTPYFNEFRAKLDQRINQLAGAG